MPEFEKRYYLYYVEEVPGEALTDRESEFFGYVQEKLDWTAEDPPLEDRRYGWINHAEYVEWVRHLRDCYLSGEPLSLV